MGKKHITTDEQKLQEVKQEYYNFSTKTHRRSATANTAHYRYIWTLISEFADGNLRMSWFTRLGALAKKLKVNEH